MCVCVLSLSLTHTHTQVKWYNWSAFLKGFYDKSAPSGYSHMRFSPGVVQCSTRACVCASVCECARVCVALHPDALPPPHALAMALAPFALAPSPMSHARVHFLSSHFFQGIPTEAFLDHI